MDNKSFWLAYIGSDSLTISLINFDSGKFKVASVGPEVLYQLNNESFVGAIDESLSAAATSIDLPESEEPNLIALIISPFWVASDGKISPDKIKLFESTFKELKLNPMGFISYDDAIVEEANNVDGFPASFIIVNIESVSYTVSLAYLGKIIERIEKPIVDSFEPESLENTLLEFKTDSTLPPMMIFIGEADGVLIDKVKNYSWIGKKNIETFLHLPEIKHNKSEEFIYKLVVAITSQFNPETIPTLPVDEESEISDDSLIEVDATDLGFGEADNFTVPEIEPEELAEPEPVSVPVPISISRPKFVFPKIKFPKIRFSLSKLFFIPLMVSPLLILIPFYFSKAIVTLYLTPFEITKTFVATLSPNTVDIDVNKKVVPISRQNFEIPSTVSLPTTGKKIIGEKSKGEIVIYNKQDKIQNLSQGTLLIDNQGNKYELASSAQIPASSSDLALGVINLGQIKVTAIASDIGQEFNLNKDALLSFKDFPSTALVAKAADSFSGGSKSEVAAISAADKTKANQQLNTITENLIQEKINSESQNNQFLIKGTIQTKKGRIDYNREVGEQADEITASAVNTVYIFYFTPDQKSLLLTSFLTEEEGFNRTNFNPDNFEVAVTPSVNSLDKITGQLTISGKIIPSIDSLKVAKIVSGKSENSAMTLVKKTYPRVYNYQIITNFSLLKAINPLPYRLSNITIETR